MATQNMSQTPLRSRSPDGAGMEQVLNPVSTLERSRMASCSSAKGIFFVSCPLRRGDFQVREQVEQVRGQVEQHDNTQKL